MCRVYTGAMKIGELASASSTPVETIRFYEREGLLPAMARSSGNYRIYEEAHLERLRFIRHCRGLDMSLEEVRVLLGFRDAPDAAGCANVDAVLDEHIGHVARRVRELRALEKELRELRQRCAGGVDGCGILNGLAEGASRSRGPAKRSHLPPVHGRQGKMQS